jgi:hypothetical protein
VRRRLAIVIWPESSFTISIPLNIAGYSGTPLINKLGIKEGTTVLVMNAPAHYGKLLGPLPAGVRLIDRTARDLNFVHLFTSQRRELQTQLTRLRKQIEDAGTLWVSWPKKSSGVATDITEDTIRNTALPLGFVDTKVCAVDETWSGLKLMIRRENRKPKP